MGGGWYKLYRRRASLAACHIEKRVWPVPGRCGLRLTGRRVGDDERRLLKTSSRLLFLSLDRTPATDFEEASGAAQAARGIPVRCQ
jgi:hypothetical protein